ncbi:hypothetical protein LOZ53_006768 [Ophidiomyces ophidiicola]|uniref:Uncharacterized protein n=1 Tax=Ophidiomyces ophidiicola TaxID=1387563 RepID=A0ACB8UNU7_9EURO|nr:hypothetical protein LOZ64_006090 [Ophidiomyces ophidiicola]KAI1932970.1 hypothetical protein LOZ62_006540 [Ophidiomyces ophidiicola]KAI1962282.1 hypothetical protein LOZ59_002112 [Ophidiomyces ophidiicola]KAI1963060.1 hypothetical protein LOZ56_006489 [Ophidiomyces ophidiicola]KAI1979358.1 hypothetical protein LOZ53_006768 [Ophidiomyces ophidiicola]
MASPDPLATPKTPHASDTGGSDNCRPPTPLSLTYSSKAQFSPDVFYNSSLTENPYIERRALSFDLQSEIFLLIAARAYQEAVTLPESPPPAVWAPNDKMHSWYKGLLSRFGVTLQSILGRQGVYDHCVFRNEWLRHGRSITDNIRSEWGLHPMGSTASVRTTLMTKYTHAALLAVEATLEAPTMPPPEGWRAGDNLHAYYETMLRRFDIHLNDMLEKYGSNLFHTTEEIQNAANDYKEYIILHYRKTWIHMFGLLDNKTPIGKTSTAHHKPFIN